LNKSLTTTFLISKKKITSKIFLKQSNM